MADDFAAIFDNHEPANPEPVEVEPAPQVEEPAPEPEPEPAAPEPAVVEPEAAPQPRDDNGRYVPLAVVQEERAKRQELERRLAEVESRTAPKPEPQARPDPYDDPDGFTQSVDERIASTELNIRFGVSEKWAKKEFGAETVDTAKQWALDQAQTVPGFREQYLSQEDPIDWAVRQHKRDGVVSQLGDDPDEYVRRRAAELGFTAAPAAVIPVAVATQQASPPAVVPRSLASVSTPGSDLRNVPVGEMAALDAVFPR